MRFKIPALIPSFAIAFAVFCSPAESDAALIPAYTIELTATVIDANVPSPHWIYDALNSLSPNDTIHISINLATDPSVWFGRSIQANKFVDTRGFFELRDDSGNLIAGDGMIGEHFELRGGNILRFESLSGPSSYEMGFFLDLSTLTGTVNVHAADPEYIYRLHEGYAEVNAYIDSVAFSEVPDTSSTLGLLLIGFSSIALVRRRRTASRAPAVSLR